MIKKEDRIIKIYILSIKDFFKNALQNPEKLQLKKIFHIKIALKDLPWIFSI